MMLEILQERLQEWKPSSASQLKLNPLYIGKNGVLFTSVNKLVPLL
jgi:hypothetical protein